MGEGAIIARRGERCCACSWCTQFLSFGDPSVAPMNRLRDSDRDSDRPAGRSTSCLSCRGRVSSTGPAAPLTPSAAASPSVRLRPRPPDAAAAALSPTVQPAPASESARPARTQNKLRGTIRGTLCECGIQGREAARAAYAKGRKACSGAGKTPAGRRRSSRSAPSMRYQRRPRGAAGRRGRGEPARAAASTP